MPAVVLYFHLHQPLRLKPFSLFDLSTTTADLNEAFAPVNQPILHKVAAKCYRPANQMMLDLIRDFPDFKLSYSISGTLVEQLSAYEPDIIFQLQQLAASGRVEFLDETYYHSLASLFSPKEFFRQVSLHRQMIRELFNQEPKAFRNTELIYNNQLAETVAQMGYQTILAEGVERYLWWRSPNFIYQPPGLPQLKLLLKNYRLSDDIAFRFSNRDWSGFPVTADKYAHWLSALNGSAQVVNLFMDYETLGEHQWDDTGIFEFFRHLPAAVYRHPDNRFLTVSEASEAFPIMDTVEIPENTSWADLERDVTAWLGNPLQQQASAALYALESPVYQAGDQNLIKFWQQLTTSDHFYYMCTKWFADGDVHKYFSPNNSPLDAYTYFMNVLHALRLKLYANQTTSPLEANSYQLITGIPAHDYRYSSAL